MGRLIDADALMKELEHEAELADDWKTAHEIVNVVKYFPTIEQEQWWIPDACRYCSNHPSNGGSGICLCTLGSIQWT